MSDMADALRVTVIHRTCHTHYQWYPYSPTPGLDGEIVRIPCQESLPWGITKCQYTYISIAMDRQGIDAIGLYYGNIAHVNFYSMGVG